MRRFLTILTFIVGLSSIVAPIAWDRYKSRAGLEVKETGSALLVEKTAALGKLRVEYDSKPIERVSQLSFVLSNTGRTVIRADDVVSPPTIHVRDSDLLDARVDEVSPSEMDATIEARSTENAVRVHFPLLNPGDSVHFTLLVNGSSPTWDADARIAGIKRLTVSQADPRTSEARSPLTWTFYVVAFGTALSVLVFLLYLSGLGKEVAFRALMRAGVIQLPSSGNRSDYERFLRDVLHPTKSSAEIIPALAVLAPIEADRPLDDAERIQFSNAVSAIMMDIKDILVGTWVFGTLASAGSVYIIWRLW